MAIYTTNDEPKPNFWSRDEIISWERAAAILMENDCDFQRNLKPRIAEYENYMKRGEFVGAGQIKIATFGGDGYLVNGRHRLTAQVNTKTDGIGYVITTVECNSLDEVKLYYIYEDCPIPRTLEDALKLLETAERMGVPNTFLRYSNKALTCIEKGFVSQKNIASHSTTPNDLSFQTKMQIEDKLEAWETVIQQAYNILSCHPAGPLRKMVSAPTLSVIFVTLKHQPEKAFTFWSAIAANNALRPGTPEHTYHKLLTSSAGKGKEGIPLQQMTRAAIAAWNAYFQSKPQSCIQLNITSALKIAGTPCDVQKTD